MFSAKVKECSAKIKEFSAKVKEFSAKVKEFSAKVEEFSRSGVSVPGLMLRSRAWGVHVYPWMIKLWLASQLSCQSVNLA